MQKASDSSKSADLEPIKAGSSDPEKTPKQGQENHHLSQTLSQLKGNSANLFFSFSITAQSHLK